MSDGTSSSERLVAEPPAVGPTMADEDRARSDEKRFRVVAIVAAVLFAPTVIAHIAVPVFVVPTFRDLFASMGGTLPAPTAFLVAMGAWLAVPLVAFDALVFWGFARLARRYWIGLLFAPLFAGGILAVPIIWALYVPMFEIVTLVK